MVLLYFRMQMSGPKLQDKTTHAQLGRPQFTQADLYNYLYRRNHVTPLSEEDLRKERGAPKQVYCK